MGRAPGAGFPPLENTRIWAHPNLRVLRTWVVTPKDRSPIRGGRVGRGARESRRSGPSPFASAPARGRPPQGSLPSSTAPAAGASGVAPPAGTQSQAERALLECVAAIACGDNEALEQLMDATSDLVLALARRVVRDTHEAEETVLDVYRYVWERAHSYDRTRGSVKSWLMTIARSRALDRARALRSRSLREGPKLELSLDAADGGDSPQDLLARAECGDALDRALGSLAQHERTAIELAFFRGLTHPEIAKRTGQPLGTIKSQIRRGLIKLHGLVKSLDFES